MSLVQNTGKIEPTDFSAYAAAPFSNTIDHTQQNRSGTYFSGLSASDWTLNSVIYRYDSQSTENRMSSVGFQNKIILIKWGGTQSYVEYPYYEYGVWKGAAEYGESGTLAMHFKTIYIGHMAYSVIVADYVIKEQSLGGDNGFGFKVTKSNVRLNYLTGSGSTRKWKTSILTSSALYPMEISFLSPNVFPIFS